MVNTNKYAPDLLEYLAFRIGAMYLSDLHNERYAYRLQPILCGMEIDHYSLKDWEDAIHYITGKQKRNTNLDKRRQAVGRCKKQR